MLERNKSVCAQLHFNIRKEIGAKFKINCHWNVLNYSKQVGTLR